MADEINLQKAGSTRIFGVTKMGANKTDINAIKVLQKQGYNEHEIQQQLGVHYSVIRSYMKSNDSEYEQIELPPTADTKHLHDRIAKLEIEAAKLKAEDEDEDEAEDEDEDEEDDEDEDE